MKCNKCNGSLCHEDTLDHFGGLEDGYYAEEQYFVCDTCNAGYVVIKEVCFDNSKIKVTQITEND